MKADLDTFKVTDFPIEHVTNLPTVTLPKSGDVIKWRMFAGEADEESISKTMEANGAGYMSVIMARRIVAINGAKPDGSLTYVTRMNSKDRRFFGQAIDKNEGGIDIEVQFTCDKLGCGSEQSRKIDVLNPSFFFPTDFEESSPSPTLLKPGDEHQTSPIESPSESGSN